MSAERISLVLIGLNVERFLPECLASVSAAHVDQDRIEKIYVDSGSTDRSCQIVAAEAGWRVLHLGDPHPSVAKGRNMGIANATSPLVQLLDADMLLDPDWLPLASSLLEQDARLAVVFGRTIERYADRNIYHRMRNAIWSMHGIGDAERLPGASLLRRAALNECGLHRQNVRGFEDVELAHRLRATGYRLVGRPEVMCRHDSDMCNFGQYWRSNVRGGQGNYDILKCAGNGARGYFLRELRRSMLWPVVCISGLAAALACGQILIGAICLAAFGLAALREVRRGWRHGGTLANGLSWSLHWVLSKMPYCAGFLGAYWVDHVRSGGKPPCAQ